MDYSGFVEHQEELRLLEKSKLEYTEHLGVYKLPDIEDKDTGELIWRELYHRPSVIKEIIHQREVVCSGIYGLAFLRTNRQIMEEGIAVLYGENKFVFDAEIPQRFSRQRYIRDPDMTEEIASILRSMDHAPACHRRSKGQRRANDPRWLQDVQHRRCRREPLMGFLTQIGFTNTALIQNLRINGLFELLRSRLPLYCKILERVCSSMKHLSIFQAGILEDLIGWNFQAFTSGRTEESLIREVVYWLPGLQQLRLESKRKLRTENNTDRKEDAVWAKTIPWEVKAAKEYEERREEMKDAATTKKICDVKEYFSKRR